MKTTVPCTLFAVLALAFAACGDSDKAGGSGDEVTLRVGTDDDANKPAARQIEEFARQVEALSGKKIRVEPVYQAAGEAPDDWDQKVARLVTAGKLEAGIIPARAWDTEGVTTLRPLSAPFLLTSDDAVNRVVTGDVASELLEGLGEAGVVGLALVPEGLRHPFGFKKPLIGLEDYRGQGFRAPRSDTTFALVRALGAHPLDTDGVAVDREIAAGRLAGAETSFAHAHSLPVRAATGNVTFFPKVNSLVVNADTWEDLTDEQRSQLREAARRTRDWAIENTVTDAEAAAEYCERGGRVVMASDAEVEALVRAARPVYEQLERDERTATLIEKVRAIAGDAKVGATDVEACAPSSASATPRAEETSEGIPDGVYRANLSVDDLVRKGMDPSTAREYNGVSTVELRDGKLMGTSKSDKPAAPCRGFYASTATTLDITFADDTCSGGFTAMWELRDDMLHLSDIKSTTAEETAITRAVFGAKPWKKID